MTVAELIEELKSLRTHSEIRIEIGGALQKINHVYCDKKGRAFVTDSLIPHGIPLQRLDTIREELKDLENDVDNLRIDVYRVYGKIERVLTLLDKYGTNR